LGKENAAKLRLAVMDMWLPFRKSTQAHASNAAVLFDKFHILRHLGEALDKVRKQEYARLTGDQRKFIKGQKYVLLSHRENLTREGKQSLKLLLAANKRLNTAYILRESFDQLWAYRSEVWAAFEAIREVRRDDRETLGRHRHLLQTGKQSGSRLRRRT